jgi:hypothetical protein
MKRWQIRIGICLPKSTELIALLHPLANTMLYLLTVKVQDHAYGQKGRIIIYEDRCLTIIKEYDRASSTAPRMKIG